MASISTQLILNTGINSSVQRYHFGFMVWRSEVYDITVV